MQTKSQRPVFLDLRVLGPKMPLVAIMSILNRVTGALMFVTTPFMVWLLGLSLAGSDGYQQALAVLDSFLAKLWLIALLWAVTHHMLAGIRFILIDVDLGVEKAQAQQSALWVIAAGGAVAALALIGVML